MSKARDRSVNFVNNNNDNTNDSNTKNAKPAGTEQIQAEDRHQALGSPTNMYARSGGLAATTAVTANHKHSRGAD